MMWEFAVSENSVIRGLRASRGSSMCDVGARSSHDLGTTSRALLSPFVGAYESIFEDRIENKATNLFSLFMATKAKLDHFKRQGYLPPPELHVEYVMFEKNNEGKDVAKIKHCIWLQMDSLTEKSLRFYRAEVDSNNRWTKVGNGKEHEGTKNFEDLYGRLEDEAAIKKLSAGTGEDPDLFSGADLFSDENSCVETVIHHFSPLSPRSPRFL